MSITALGFLFVYVVGLIAALSSVCVWAFLVYQFVYFTNPGDRWWGHSIPSIPYSLLTVVVMAICVMVPKRHTIKSRIFDVPQTKWVLGIFLVHLMVLPIALNENLHEERLIELLKLCIVMGFAFKILNNPERLRQSLYMFLVGATYIGWEAYSVGRDRFGRVEGIGPIDSPDANGVAAAIVPAVPIILCLISTGTFKERVFAAGCGIWIVNGLVLINSRGAFVAAVVSCLMVLLYLFGSRMQQASQRISAVLAILVGLGGVLWLADDAFWERMNTLNSIEDEDTSGSHRYRLWLVAFDIVEDYPLGTGAKGYNRLSQFYVPPELLANKSAQKSVHSTWFQSLAETGWIGVTLLIAMVVSCFRSTRWARQLAIARGDPHAFWTIVAIETGLLSYLVAASFIDRLRAEVLYWFVMYTACVYNVYVIQQQGAVNKSQEKNHSSLENMDSKPVQTDMHR